MTKDNRPVESQRMDETDQRWNDLLRRNAAKDGKFVYSVEGTGIYCQPSCGGRLPAPETVSFFDSAADAEKAGLRPCQRCRPDLPPRSERHAVMVAELCKYMEESEDSPSLQSLADMAGISMYHLHRIFKSITGVTPKAYADEVRTRKMRRNLNRKTTITAAIYNSGYGSSSRFYEQSGRRLGMTPRDFRRGGSDVSIVFSVTECWLGFVLVAASQKGICAITMGEAREPLVKELYSMFPEAESIAGDGDFDRLVARIVSFIEQPGEGLDLPLDVQGTAFQHRVWKALLAVPSGTTVSYAELAKRIGSPKAVRAVAQACDANKIAVAIPCHRVIRSDGELSSYRWEAKRKRALIEKEKEYAAP